MNILYVCIVVAFTFTMISSLESVKLQNLRTNQVTKERVLDFLLAKELAEIATASIDYFKTNNGCGGGRSPRLLAPGKTACWPSNGGGGCFNIRTTVYSSQGASNTICFSNATVTSNGQNQKYQNLATTSLKSKIDSLCLILGCGNEASADVVDQNVTKNANTTNYGVYTPLPNKVNPPGGGGSNSVSFTSMPANAGANNVSTNFVNCGSAVTECYTITFCLLNSTNCAMQDRFEQTFALRRF